MKLGHRRLLLRHCAWCQPLNRGWRRLVAVTLGRTHLPVYWTSGVCDRCFPDVVSSFGGGYQRPAAKG